MTNLGKTSNDASWTCRGHITIRPDGIVTFLLRRTRPHPDRTPSLKPLSGTNHPSTHLNIPTSSLELIERLLEGTMNRKAAQKLRRWQHEWQSRNVNTLVLDYVEAETKLRFNIQREARVQVEHEALFISSTKNIDNDKRATASTVSRVEALQKELRSLSEGI